MVKTKKISEKDLIAKVLEEHPETAEIFIESGFHCLGCPMSRMETLEQGCNTHGFSKKEITVFLEKLNNKISKK